MRSLIILFSILVFSQALFAAYVDPSSLDLGDGSDGACNFTSADNPLGGTYNCTTLTISGGTAVTANSGGAALVFKVQGDVIISADLNLSGDPGVAGVADDTDKVVAVGGPAAGNGGDYTAGIAGNGTGSCLGLAGTVGANTSGTTNQDGDGGGGGGGCHQDLVTNQNGSNGTSGNPGTGGLRGTTTYGDFTTNFLGGSGGGAGGRGELLSFAGRSGGGGGGGGGAVQIIAGGDISISGTVQANGGAGGDSTLGGGGGGGSGGAIFLQAVGSIIASGTISATAGAGGTSSLGTGNGGAGSRGMIRLDDFDGVVGGSISPTASTNYTGTSLNVPVFESSISCGTVEPVLRNGKSSSENTIYSFIFLLLSILISSSSFRFFSFIRNS